jgi:pectinesterase
MGQGQDAGYVFNHCKITAERGAGDVYLGRPWRDYSTVIFMNTDIETPIMEVGWSDWKGAAQPRLPMATYAEFNSKGPGANAKQREPYLKQLTAEEAEQYATKTYLAGTDGGGPNEDGRANAKRIVTP